MSSLAVSEVIFSVDFSFSESDLAFLTFFAVVAVDESFTGSERVAPPRTAPPPGAASGVHSAIGIVLPARLVVDVTDAPGRRLDRRRHDLEGQLHLADDGLQAGARLGEVGGRRVDDSSGPRRLPRSVAVGDVAREDGDRLVQRAVLERGRPAGVEHRAHEVGRVVGGQELEVPDHPRRSRRARELEVLHDHVQRGRLGALARVVLEEGPDDLGRVRGAERHRSAVDAVRLGVLDQYSVAARRGLGVVEGERRGGRQTPQTAAMAAASEARRAVQSASSSFKRWRDQFLRADCGDSRAPGPRSRRGRVGRLAHVPSSYTITHLFGPFCRIEG